jgi:hypothetical protein
MKILIYEYEKFIHPGTDDIKSVWYHKDRPANWCHTLQEGIFMPSFGDHPEYYALINGERSKLQPCLSNPDLLEYVSNQISQINTAKIIDISIGDNNAWCECDQCKKQAPSATLVNFLNRIASRYPDQKFSTLAYYQTQRPSIRPLPNIMVTLTTITVPKDEPIECGTRYEAIDFREDLRGWKKLTGNLCIWDYTCMFHHLLMPFPVTRNIAYNIRWCAKQGVKNFIVQNNSGIGHEFSELKSELIVAMMNNPKQNVHCIINRIGRSYYGKAWKYVKRYMNRLSRYQSKGRWITNWDRPQEFRDSFLSDVALEEYDEILGKAYVAVAGYIELSKRVRVVRLQVWYASIELGIATDLDRMQFMEICSKLGDVTMNEEHLSYKDYLNERRAI